MTAHPPPRVAIYARVSTDNQMSGEEGSLATQEATLRAAAAIKFGDDATIRVFREEAASGKSLDRPALQRLLKAVERDEIDHVTVTRIDRVSRSLVDFMNLHATFEAAKVGFHSIKDSFDTSGAFGMAMLQILLVSHSWNVPRRQSGPARPCRLGLSGASGTAAPRPSATTRRGRGSWRSTRPRWPSSAKRSSSC